MSDEVDILAGLVSLTHCRDESIGDLFRVGFQTVIDREIKSFPVSGNLKVYCIRQDATDPS